MPDVARYLQRVSFLLRQGEPVADVALYLPTSDAWAHFTPGHVNLFEALRDRIGPDVLGTIGTAGFGLDLFDDEALAARGRVDGNRLLFGDLAYRLVIVPGVERMPPATMRTLALFARSGGIVLATRRLPARAPGLQATADEHAEVQNAAARLFQQGDLEGTSCRTNGSPCGTRCSPQRRRTFGSLLPRRRLVSSIGGSRSRISTSSRTRRTRRCVRRHRFARTAGAWRCGTRSRARCRLSRSPRAGNHFVSIPLTLEPYASRVVVFTDRVLPLTAPVRVRTLPAPIPLSDSWRIGFPGEPPSAISGPLRSWSDDVTRRFFSGVASVHAHRQPSRGAGARRGRRTIGLRRSAPDSCTRPDERDARMARHPGARGCRRLDQRHARRIGLVPAYALDVTGGLRAGDNDIRIDVANLAVNRMAGQPLPSYRLLNARYGTRFEPQDMDKVQPEPAGLLGDVRLVPFAR